MYVEHAVVFVLIWNYRDLAPAIQQVEDFRIKMAQFPPITSGTNRETKSFAKIMDETMLFME
jgi:beta-1,4-N-acetylglucosaminyltransferase